MLSNMEYLIFLWGSMHPDPLRGVISFSPFSPLTRFHACVNQTFVRILSGNFISISTGVVMHVGLALAAEQQFIGRSVHSRTSQLCIDQTRRQAYQLDYQLFVGKHSGFSRNSSRKPGKIAFIVA